MEFVLLDFFILHPYVGYALIFFGMFFEGDLFLFAATFLANLGVFDITPVLIVTFFGMTIGDILWYRLGIYQEKLPSWLQKLILRIASPFDAMLVNKPFMTLFITKFTYGAHHLVLARAGGNRLDLKRFIKSDIGATLLWIAVIASLGYFGSFAFSQIKEYVRFAEVGLLVGFVLIILLEKAVRVWARGR